MTARMPFGWLVSLAAAGGLISGCGSGDGPGSGPPVPVFTSLLVALSESQLYVGPPGNTTQIVATPRDQNGQPMVGLGTPSYASSNNLVATVSPGGTVTAVGAGTSQITASLTSAGTTHQGTVAVTVLVAPLAAGVSAPALAFQPVAVHIRAGGAVTWTMQTIPHNVTFTTGNAPADIATFSEGNNSRTFPTAGSFSYECTVHPSMLGTVHVH